MFLIVLEGMVYAVGGVFDAIALYLGMRIYNGQSLPESSYVYLIDKNGDGEIDQKGWIYIAR